MATPEKTAFDFRSDTVTLPSAAMKDAMMSVELGDDVYGEDPTSQALQRKIAELTGMPAALFFPSGSMANLTALMVHAAPGRVLYAGARCHIKLFELGSYARVAGLNLFEIDDSKGWLSIDEIASKWNPDIYYMAQPGLIAVENTHNILGGLIYPPEKLAQLRAFANAKGVPLHMDGARLFHAAAAGDHGVRSWTSQVDSVMISISKGLGAPVGSLLVGSHEFIESARAIRKLLGGGMRQSGVLAAAGLYALDHNLDLLKQDNQRCREVYEAIKDLPWLEATEPGSNILIFHTHEPVAAAVVADLTEGGVRALNLSDRTIRVVFHLNNSDSACERLIGLIRAWRVRH